MREHDAAPNVGRVPDASPPNSPLDRRRFLQVVGLGLTQAALAVPAVSFAQSGGAGKPAKPDAPASVPMTPATPEGPPPPSDDAKALAEIIRRRYGQHLTPEQMDAVTRQIDQGLQGGKRLKDVKLGNGDEPDFTFRVEAP